MVDLATYRAFYQASVRPLAAHLRRLGVRRDEDLEDLIQETYAEAFRCWSALRDEEARLSWLLTIGRRRVARLRRAGHRLPSLLEDVVGTLDEDAGPAEDRVASAERGADEQVQERALAARVVAAVGEIPDERRRRAVSMFYLEEMQLPEVSAATGVKVSTLTTWLSRFRERVRTLMADEPRHRAKDGRARGDGAVRQVVPARGM